MKKLLLMVLILIFASPVHAGLISITTLSNDMGIDFNYFNTSFNTFKNWANGNVESINLKDGTITVDDMASSSSPAQREGDHFNAYTKTGMLPADDVLGSYLTSDISAGTSYVESDAGLLYRVVTAATSHTYTASLDTWVYIDKNGTFQFVTVAVGGAQPATPSNSLLLAKVRTDGTEITSVTDHRVTTISLGATEDYYIKGMQLLYSTTAILSVDTGIVRVGSSTVTKTTATTLNTATDSDYIDGASAGDLGADKFMFVYANSSGSIKYDAHKPDYHDTTGITQGTKFYYKYGAVYWRNLGCLSMDVASLIKNDNSVRTLRQGEKVVQVVNYETGTLSPAGTVIMPADGSIPQITEGNEYMRLSIQPTSASNKIRVDVDWDGATDNATAFIGVFLFKIGTANALAGSSMQTAANQTQHHHFTYYMTAGTTNPITFMVRAGNSGGNSTWMNGNNVTNFFGGTALSGITLTELTQ